MLHVVRREQVDAAKSVRRSAHDVRHGVVFQIQNDLAAIEASRRVEKNHFWICAGLGHESLIFGPSGRYMLIITMVKTEV